MRRRHAIVLAAGLALSPLSLLGAEGIAHAEPVDTVNLSDVPWIDSLPTCAVEDCSDQPGQVGLWTSREGNAYIEIGEGVTVLVIDDTAR